tara:strand:+ start:295 stop:654 length:360 start_codon:yes stop_codon:yes gene_type:complete
MAAGIYNFTIEQGATFTRTFKYKDSEGNPIDLVSGDGYVARMEIKDKIGGNQIAFFSSNGTGLGINNTNFITLTISAGSTSSYNFTTAVYDLEIVSSTGVVTRLLQGKIKLSKEVTTSS